mmetsp:Transcript_7655/g.22674  ORF Transcript_7655/g.22674 Transcript_7655/m.22674 type:complete len:147 (+) Transcript_7655:440-880(+)
MCNFSEPADMKAMWPFASQSFPLVVRLGWGGRSVYGFSWPHMQQVKKSASRPVCSYVHTGQSHGLEDGAGGGGGGMAPTMAGADGLGAAGAGTTGVVGDDRVPATAPAPAPGSTDVSADAAKRADSAAAVQNASLSAATASGDGGI